MGAQPSAPAGKKGQACAFTPKERYNLKQVYFYLCLHTTTLTSCPLDRNQFHSLMGSNKQYKPLWRALFTAIDLNGDSVIDFEEFLAFVTNLKRGDTESRREFCFRLFDPNRDGMVERSDFKAVTAARAASMRKPNWHQARAPAQEEEEDPDDEFMQFFSTCDENGDGKFCYEDFESYCLLHGDAIVAQTLKLVEVMFEGVTEETGIVITAIDVKNTKPHIDWQDHKIGMGSFFCCSSPPVFTTPPLA